MFVESASVTRETANVSQKVKGMGLTNRKRHDTFFSGLEQGAQSQGEDQLAG